MCVCVYIEIGFFPYARAQLKHIYIYTFLFSFFFRSKPLQDIPRARARSHTRVITAARKERMERDVRRSTKTTMEFFFKIFIIICPPAYIMRPYIIIVTFSYNTSNDDGHNHGQYLYVCDFDVRIVKKIK